MVAALAVAIAVAPVIEANSRHCGDCCCISSTEHPVRLFELLLATGQQVFDSAVVHNYKHIIGWRAGINSTPIVRRLF